MAIMVQHETGERLPVTALDLDETEQGLLVVMRHFLTSFAQPASQAWTLAFGLAAERWGLSEGPARAQALLAVLMALRAGQGAAQPDAGRGPLAFTDPLSLTARAFMTPDEAAVMALIHAMRRDRTAQAREALGRLTGGRMDVGVIRAGLALAAHFPAANLDPAGSFAAAAGAQLH